MLALVTDNLPQLHTLTIGTLYSKLDNNRLTALAADPVSKLRYLSSLTISTRPGDLGKNPIGHEGAAALSAGDLHNLTSLELR